jgi:hypothetical protein
MPVVGEPSQFAVEYDLNPNHGGEWMFGRICYWCDGRRVGNYELSTSLRDVLFELDGIAKYRHSRSNPRFSILPAVAVFRLVDAALFGNADLNNAQIAEEEQWARHKIFPAVDVFDFWKGYLVEDEKTARFIFAQGPYQDVAEFPLRAGEVDAIFDVVRSALDRIYAQESRGLMTKD